MDDGNTVPQDPRKRDDSVVGLTVECVIIDLYDASGRVLAMPTDPDVLMKAMKQGQELAVYHMRKKFPPKP